MSIPSKPVIIVGAGLSGLYAAKILSASNVPVKVLEAQDRVGGRSLTETITIGTTDVEVDQGAGYVGQGQTEVLALLETMGIQTKPVPSVESGKFTFSLGNDVRHSYIVLADLYHYLSLREFLAMVAAILDTYYKGNSIPLDSPWTAEDADEWDAMTVENWLDIRFPGADYANAKTMFQFISRTPLGIEASETSLLYFLWYMKSAQSFFSILFTAQESIVLGGTQQISTGLAQGLDVSTLQNVIRISHSDTGVSVSIENGAQPIEGDRVVLATAPHVRSRIAYDPLLEPQYHQVTQRSPMGTTIKVHLYYSNRFWSNMGYNGNVSIFDSETVSQIYDVTESDVIFCLQGFYVGKVGRDAAKLTPAQRQSDVEKELKRVFDDTDDALSPIGYSEYIWDNHTYVGGAPVGTCSTGTLTSFGEALRTPTGRIHFAGTETSPGWAGYMEGALRAGKRVANEILSEYSLPTVPDPLDDAKKAKESLSHIKELLSYAAKASKKMM